MPHRIVTLLAALVVAATLAPSGPGPAGAVEEGEDPLQVSIETLSPAVIPERGPIQISGTVTNLDRETWTTVKLYSFVSATPMTTGAELEAAAALPADAVLGDRIADPAYSGTVDEIAPGDTVPFSFSVPRSSIPVSEPGVYWFGVQALGQGPSGRDLSADGRARTFISLVPPTAEPLPTAVVLPLRRQIQYADDGSLDDLPGWIRALDTGGRLRSLVDFGGSAGSRSVTWLVDPALVDAVGRLAAGNPPRSLRPTVVPEGEEPAEDADPSATAQAEESESTEESDETGAAQAESTDPDTAQAQALAADWLDRLGRALPGHQVLGLPYGDVDVAGAAAISPRSYTAGRRRTGATLAPYDVQVDPAVSSPGGYLDQAGIDLVDPADLVLLTDTAVVGPDEQAGPETPTVATDGEHRIVLTSAASVSGVGPGDLQSPLSVRQQMLAQAAVRTLAPTSQPLAVMLPHDWNPVTSSGFFSGLDVSWIDLLSVGQVSSRAAAQVSVDDLYYPRSQSRSQITRPGFDAAGDLSRAGEQVQNLLRDNDQIARTVRDQALASVSYSARSEPLTSRLAAAESTRWIEARLHSVHIEAPRAFTMTGTEGRFSTTVVNDLDEAVTVGVRATVTSGISVGEPEIVDVPAGGQARVLLNATAPEGGIHNVRLELVDTDGDRIGESDTLTIRSLAVSNVIWLFLGAAGLLLFGAIAFRLVKRVRAARRASVPSRRGSHAAVSGRATLPADATPVDS